MFSMYKNSVLFTTALSLIFIPNIAQACGGSLFSVYSWMIYISYLLFSIHFFVFYKLTSIQDVSEKEKIAKNYAVTLLGFHLIPPAIIVLTAIFIKVVHACIDTRSEQEIFLDGLSFWFCVGAVISMFVSILFMIGITAKRRTAEKKVALAKKVALGLGISTFILTVYLAHGYFIVAPTLSESRGGVIYNIDQSALR